MKALCDADVYAYACGFATQKTVDGVVVAEPVENALAMTKRALETIYEELNSWLGQSGERVAELTLYLTGKDNFRDKLATIRGYKANRKDKPKPVHYKAIRDYMVRVWGATVVEGYEADDALAMGAHALDYDPERVCIISVDKDLKTVPGLLYSPKKKESFLISAEEARANFYRQMITGDSSDNILGVYKAGAKAAEAITEDMSEEVMWLYVLSLFEKSTERKGCPYSEYRKAAIETGRLLHLWRYPGDAWEPPDYQPSEDFTDG